MTTCYTHHDSPLGPLLLTASERGLSRLYMQSQRHASDTPEPHWRRDDTRFDAVREQLDEYFAGRRQAFDLPLDLALDLDGTLFQQSVWKALTDIAYGATISYAELARRIGNPKAVRAVGLANGRNPVSIIVPCHRVIGANGSLTGYGGGLERKRWLLELEGQAAQLL